MFDNNNNEKIKIKNFECDYVISIANLGECHNKGESIEYECIHPPSIKYNQYEGEYGYYLGPDPQPSCNS